MALRQQLIEESEDGKVTMVEWNKQWQKFTRSRDVFILLIESRKLAIKRDIILSMLWIEQVCKI